MFTKCSNGHMLSELQPGQVLARGLCRHLFAHDFVGLTEFVPARGLRVDVIALGPKGQIWVIECKSSRADFMADNKWHGYLEWCDRFFWCVDGAFPTDILPSGAGLIVADGYDAQILEYGPETALAPARRKALTLKICRTAMQRVNGYQDPRPADRFSAVLPK